MTRTQVENKYDVFLERRVNKKGKKYWNCLCYGYFVCNGWTIKEIHEKLKSHNQ
jgi:hypothetical protein